MSSLSESTSDLVTWRKRLIFRSWHRGTREMDLIMGRFADRLVPTMGPTELEEYERLLTVAEPDLYNWLTDAEPVPEAWDGPVYRSLKGFIGDTAG